MGKNIVITGTSSGIGLATAKVLLKAGCRVFGSVRRLADAKALIESGGDRFHPLVFDITDESSVLKGAQEVKKYLPDGENLLGLVNNAGIGLGGPLEHLSLKTLRRQLEVNVVGTLAVTRAFIPLLKNENGKAPAGRIINISSVAGRRALPFTGPYVASKHALEGLSDSLRMELQLCGIDVILVEPGPVRSEIWNKMPDPENNPFLGTEYEPALRRFYRITMNRVDKALPAERVGELVRRIIESPHPRARYVITRHKWRDFILPGLLPTRLIDRKIGKFLGLLKP
ncbi:MAG: SDR family oxidoreductase [FCB group bacterium]|nr:SDR family oxidoreductase [FCB group bacterium]